MLAIEIYMEIGSSLSTQYANIMGFQLREDRAFRRDMALK